MITKRSWAFSLHLLIASVFQIDPNAVFYLDNSDGESSALENIFHYFEIFKLKPRFLVI